MRDPEKLRAARHRYDTSAKGKARRRRVERSAKGKARKKRYEQSVKGKVMQLRYEHSAKGKAVRKAVNARRLFVGGYRGKAKTRELAEQIRAHVRRRTAEWRTAQQQDPACLSVETVGKNGN